jgi:ABC-type transporter Mla maintaining outer membrane lipid asymmetry permease subunit MlaE
MDIPYTTTTSSPTLHLSSLGAATYTVRVSGTISGINACPSLNYYGFVIKEDASSIGSVTTSATTGCPSQITGADYTPSPSSIGT